MARPRRPAATRGGAGDDTAQSDPEVRFRGRPYALEAYVPAASAQRRSISVEVELPEALGGLPPRSLTSPAGPDQTLVRLVLPATTPPGRYPASVHAPEQTWPAWAEVAEYPHLSVSPRRLHVTAEAGSSVAVGMDVLNDGNVPCRVRKSYAFGLFEAGGLERAIGAGLSNRESAQSRLDTIIDTAAEAHGGLVRLTVAGAPYDLAPGQLQRLEVSLRLPERMAAGRTYTGTWGLYNLQYSVEIAVPGRQPQPVGDAAPGSSAEPEADPQAVDPSPYHDHEEA